LNDEINLIMKILLLFFTTITVLSAVSQPVFGPEGATWYFTTHNIAFSSLLRYEVSGYDTIDGLPAVHMSAYNAFSNAPFPEYNLIAHADSNRLFFHDGENFKLFSDFSAQVGDTLYPQFKHWVYEVMGMLECPYGRIVVTETGTMDINGMSLRYYEWQTIEEEFYSWEFWDGRFIERIIGTGKVWGYPGCCAGCTTISGMVCYTDPEFGDYHPYSSMVCDYYIGAESLASAAQQILIFPNPATNQLNIILPFGGNRADVYSLSGQLVMSQFVYPGWDRAAIDVSGLAGGMYMVRVVRETGEVMGTGRFIKQ
jgi:hypothetical protein